MSSTKKEKDALRSPKLTRAGATIGLVCFITLGLIALCDKLPNLYAFVRIAVFAMIAVAVPLLLTNLAEYRKAPTPEDVLSFYRKQHWWGTVLVMIGVILFTFCKPPEPVVVAAKAAVPVVIPKPEPEPEPEPEPVIVECPRLVVTAVVLNGQRSAARINGSTICIGEEIADATLVSVREDSIKVVYQGVTFSIPCFTAPASTNSTNL